MCGRGNVVTLNADALIRYGFDCLAFAERGDFDLQSAIDADVFPGGVKLANDFLIQNGEIVLGKIEDGSHDVFAGIVDYVAYAAAPIFGEDREAQSVVVEDCGFSGFEVRRFVPEVAGPVRHGAGIEVGTVRKIPHAKISLGRLICEESPRSPSPANTPRLETE